MRPIRNLLAACLTFALVACQSQPTVGEYHSSSGSLAMSKDGSELYAADADNGIVTVLNAADLKKIADVKVGKHPERIAVGADGTLYVTNKGDRTLSFIKRGTWEVTDSVVVGIEPIGVDVTADGKHVLVASSTSLTDPTVGTLSSLDAATHRIEWTIDVGPEAHAVRAMPGNKAYVSLFKSGKIAVVDLATQKVGGNIDLAGRGANVMGFGSAAAPMTTNQRVGGSPNLISDIAVAPDGERAYATHIRARDANIVQTSNGGGGYGGAQPSNISCGRGPIAAAAVGTVDVGSDSAKVDDFEKCQTGDNSDFDKLDFPANIMDPNPTGTDPVQGPEVAVVDPNGDFMYVGNLLSNNVAVVSTNRRKGSDVIGNTGMLQVIKTGTGPTGLAVSADGKTLFVHHQLDHSVGAYRPDASGRITELTQLRNRFAEDTLPANLVSGRKLFFSADNPTMTNLASAVACASCHPAGREDGRVWAFPEGPRQTPSLAGRDIAKTAPYHWAGEFPTINEFFTETVKNRMGGRGFVDAKDPNAHNLFDFLSAIERPDYPGKGAELSPAAVHGKELFAKATCNSCHSGDSFSDNKNHDVGTLVAKSFDRPGDKSVGLNTPSLLGVSRSWPYLHDGSAMTLKARLLVDKNTNRHGLTKDLNDGEVNDLVEYLKAL